MTYGGALTRLKRAGVTIVGVPVDGDGLCSEGLEAALGHLKQRGVRAKYIYTIPTVQNPTATVMSEGRRAAVLRLSEACGVPIFARSGVLLQEPYEQLAYFLRLFLLHPVACPVDQVAAQHPCARAALHLVDIAGLLIDAPVALPRDEA